MVEVIVFEVLLKRLYVVVFWLEKKIEIYDIVIFSILFEIFKFGFLVKRF